MLRQVFSLASSQPHVVRSEFQPAFWDCFISKGIPALATCLTAGAPLITPGWTDEKPSEGRIAGLESHVVRHVIKH